MEAVEPGEFGRLLRRHRVAAGFTLEELAERASLSPRGIQDLERGVNRAPRRETAARLADALPLDSSARATLLAAVERRRGPTSLPAPVSDLIGRERDEAAVGRLLHGRGYRLITLTGPGGVGKTRLALRLAERQARRYPDGSCFVPLAALRDPALVAPAVAGALGMGPGAGSARERVVAHLRARRLLLVLDNCEQLALTPFVQDLLARCPGLTILATSRSPLRAAGEREYPVAPLTLPAPARSGEREIVARAAASALFVRRATAVRPGFRLTQENAAAVAEICARLDGLPLAIELAAVRVKIMSPRALLGRLERRLELLARGPREMPARHRALRDTIAWSHDLLDAPERALFARLAVFVGGYTLEAAEAVCGGTDVRVLDGLAALVDESLVGTEEQADGEVRFRMLETIREFAAERLCESGAEPAIRRAHAAYYLALAEQAEPELASPRQGTWLATLEREHDNLRAALYWAREAGDAWMMLRLAAALARFWRLHGHVEEGRRWLEAALAVPMGPDARGTDGLRARALRGAGVLAVYQGDYSRADAAFAEAMAVFRRVGDIAGIAATLNSQGNAARDRGEYARAGSLHEESLACYRELGDRINEAMVLNNLGEDARERCDYDRAARFYGESLAIARDGGDPWQVAATLGNLGLVARERGDPARAAALHEESLALSRELGDRRGVASTLNNLGEVARDRSDWAGAESLYGEGLALYRAMGERRNCAILLTNMGLVARARYDVGRAAALYGEALDLLGADGDRVVVALCLEGLAAAAAVRERPMRAAHLAGAADALRATIDSPLAPAERAFYDASLAPARAALGAIAFDAALDRGCALSLPVAIAMAQEERCGR